MNPMDRRVLGLRPPSVDGRGMTPWWLAEESPTGERIRPPQGRHPDDGTMTGHRHHGGMRSILFALIVAMGLPGCAGGRRALEVPPDEASSSTSNPEVPVPSAPTASPASNSRGAQMLKERMRQVPDWTCLEAGNFLILHSTKIDPERIGELVRSLAAVLKVLGEEFPMDGVEETLFVVRLCKDRTQYEMYGGPGGSSGYWSPGDGEMVSYVDGLEPRRSCQRIPGLLVFAYFYRALDSVCPQDWFTNGLSTYYSGCVFNASGILVPRKNTDFSPLMGKAIEEGTLVPLEQFLRYDHARFQGPGIQRNVAQAGSFVWFLKQQRAPEWKGILSSYYEALRSGLQDRRPRRERQEDPVALSQDQEYRIRDFAWKSVFGGFDKDKWRRLERAWLDFD